MNQILSTENINSKYRKSNGSKDIKSIIKFFAIMLMIFGIFLIASSSYALYKGINGNNNEEQQQSTSQPEIEVENKDEKQLILTKTQETGSINNLLLVIIIIGFTSILTILTLFITK